MIKAYYHLIKPGIVYGNLFAALGGFFFASGGLVRNFNYIDWGLFFATMVGLGCVIASACVVNNYLDRHIDAKMERTKGRGFVAGIVSPRLAIVFAAALLTLGIKLLWVFTNPLTLSVALFGFLVYVLLYTPLKPKTGYALFVGAVAGATPPVVGYTAVINTLDLTAWLLFAFLFIWQLPHFMAIAYYRYDEYKAAGIPLLIKHAPTEHQKQIGRKVFFGSLIVLVVWVVWISF